MIINIHFLLLFIKATAKIRIITTKPPTKIFLFTIFFGGYLVYEKKTGFVFSANNIFFVFKWGL